MGCGSSSQAQGDGVPPAMPPTTAATSNTQTANEVPNGTTLAAATTTTAAPAAAAQASESAAAQPSTTEAVAAPTAAAAGPATAAPVDVPVVAAGSTAEGSSSAVVIADPAKGELVADPAAVAVPTEQPGAPASAVPVVTTQAQATDEPVVVPNPVPVPVTGAHPDAIVQQVGSTIPAVKPQAVFVLGGPGCGKGTQCAKIVKEFGWVHLSAGDLLREERERGGPRAGEIESAMKNGHIVPAEVTVQLLKAAIESHTASGRAQFLIDGFPRNVDNLQAWKAIMGAKVELLFVLYFDCTEATMRQRVLKRGESSGRVDDNEEALAKRFLTYTTDSRPVIARYEATGRAVRIDADADEEHVWQEVRKVFAPIDRDTKPMPKKETAAEPAPAAAAAAAAAPVATSEAAAPAAATDAATDAAAPPADAAAAAPVAPVAAPEAAVAPEGTNATAPPAATAAAEAAAV